jgi:anthraniloyl-CoA monooxygenase
MPLASGGWQTMGPSALAWSKDHAAPRAMTRADMDRVRVEFVAATEMAARCDFDMVELHAAHAYLISSFISPKSNIRADDYGGTLENRIGWPLEVFAAMRAAWPAERSMSVRISANDWVGDEGVTPRDAVEIAKMFAGAGADIIDASAGQTTIAAKPVYGRMFQTPFSDRIRNEAELATMAVGNITEADQVNSILLAGRADLVCLARPHLADPCWTPHAAVARGDTFTERPLPYLRGRDQARRLRERQQEAIGA